MTIDIRDLPGRLAEALAAVAAGGEVVLADGVTPCARLVPPATPRVLGLHPGAMTAADDFDAELPDSFWLGQA